MHSIRILIIDDNQADLLLIERLLKKCSIPSSCEGAASVGEALAKVSEGEFDCIIIDFHLPEINGLEGMKRIKEFCPQIPIIIITGHEDTHTAVKAIKSGADDYLSKDEITSDSLERVLLSSMEKSFLQATLREQQKALKDFSNILAHDLKNPLQNIMGFGQMAKETIEQYKNDDLEKIMTYIIDSAQRMNKLIDAANEYMILGHEAPKEHICLTQLLQSVELDLSRELFQSKAKIVYENTDVEIELNEVMMRQALQNLILNSIKYCQTTPTISIRCQKEKSHVIIEISDNGIGIDEKYLKKVFQPLIRLHNSDSYSGTGLGLAICEKIINIHHGHIEALTNSTEGVTMKITLPKNYSKNPILKKL